MHSKDQHQMLSPPTLCTVIWKVRETDLKHKLHYLSWMVKTAKGIGKHLRQTVVSEGAKTVLFRIVEPVEKWHESGTRADESGGISVLAVTKTSLGKGGESSKAESHYSENSTSARAQSNTEWWVQRKSQHSIMSWEHSSAPDSMA